MPEETFGELLRRLRERAGYSQDAFADAVGLSRKTIQTIENAKGRPTFKNQEVAVVSRMADVLGQPVPVLSTKLGWVPTGTTDQQADLDAAVWALDYLTDDEKAAVITLLRARVDRSRAS